MSYQQGNKVTIFAHDNGWYLTGSNKNLIVGCVTQTNIA